MPRRPGLLFSIAAGVALGLLAFAVESALVLKQSAIGLNIDVKGPFAALMEAVKPLVPPVLAKVAVAYAAAGAVFGWVAGLLARTFRLRRRSGAAGVFVVEFFALVALLVWDRAIVRPALFDDLQWFKPLLGWLVAHGEPWHPRAVAGGWFAAHVLVGALRVRAVRAPWMERLTFAAAMVAVALLGTQVWAHTFRSRAVETSGPSTDLGANGGPRLIVLLGIDAFRPDRLSAYGGRGGVAPNVEALLSDSTVFTNAWTPIAQTEPAWRSLLTARWPWRTGVRYPLTADARWEPAQTFPGILSEHGWETTFSTDCSRFNFQPSGTGFTQRFQPPRGALNFVLEKLRYRLLGTFADNALGAAFLPEMMENRALAGLYDPPGYAKRLGDELVASARRAPTFFAFHDTAAHFPGDPTYPFHRKFVRADAPLERRVRMFFSPISKGDGAAKRDWSQSDAEALYDELLAQADAQVGILVAALKDAGLYDDAVIILFSDHGESFHGDHPELAGATSVHGARLSEEENHILLAMKPARGMQHVPRVDALVRLNDLGPTILDLAGMPRLSDVDGVSVAPLLRGEALPEPLKLYAETGFTHASPAAFDPLHLSVAPRSFDIYRVRSDGVVEINEDAHAAILKEKDFGAFDGQRWIIRTPREDGSYVESCRGECPAPASLAAWFQEASGLPPLKTGSFAGLPARAGR